MYVAIGATVDCERDMLGIWVGDAGKGPPVSEHMPSASIPSTDFYVSSSPHPAVMTIYNPSAGVEHPGWSNHGNFHR
jgi:hypothetical protein